MKTHQGAPFCYEYGMDMLEFWKNTVFQKVGIIVALAFLMVLSVSVID